MKEELKEPMMNGISDAEDKISPPDVSKPLLITPPNITQAAQPQTSPINPNQLQHYYVAQHNKAAKPAAEDTIQSDPSPHLLADTTQPTTQAQTMNVQAHGVKRSLPPSAVVSDEPVTKSARITTSLPSAPAGQPTLHKSLSDQNDQPSTPQLDQSTNHHEPNTILTSQVTRPEVQPQVGTPQGPPNQPQVGAISVQPQVGAPQAPQVQPQVGTPRHRKSQGLDLMADNASLMVLFRNVGKQPMEDYTDEKEDPISKSVRLTSVLILLNISNFCSEGRSMLQVHEPRFAHLAMSAMDCSPMLAKLLAGLDR
uniref:Uncharacterized protein n=1 Tax=Ciona savignyi TaxID=51511 RepID=H2YXB2_CIOSA